MEIGEIISDAFRYPLNNIKALAIYAVLSIIAALVLVLTGVGVSASAVAQNGLALGATGIIGIIIAIIISLLIDGYLLDVVKFGIEKREDAPGIEIGRQVINGIKLIIVGIVYMIIPAIIAVILLMVLNNWVGILIAAIIAIIFSFALMMAQCRLAETESLSSALSIGGAIGDINKVGIVKILAVIIIVAIIAAIIELIVGAIAGLGGIAAVIGAILLGICGIYILFVSQRATGLLYSDI